MLSPPPPLPCPPPLLLLATPVNLVVVLLLGPLLRARGAGAPEPAIGTQLLPLLFSRKLTRRPVAPPPPLAAPCPAAGVAAVGAIKAPGGGSGGRGGGRGLRGLRTGDRSMQSAQALLPALIAPSIDAAGPAPPPLLWLWV